MKKPKKEIIKTILDNLESLRREWQDNRPSKIVSRRDLEYKNNKYRKNWFAAAIGFCALAFNERFLSCDLGNRVLELEDKFTGKEFKISLTKKEDIVALDNLISDVINELNNKQEGVE